LSTPFKSKTDTSNRALVVFAEMNLTSANNMNTIESLQDLMPQLSHNTRRTDRLCEIRETFSRGFVESHRKDVEFKVEDMVVLKRVNVLSVTRADPYHLQ
jgi:hypothetical protein